MYMYGLTVIGYFPTLAEEFLRAYSNIFCVLTTPRPIILIFALYLMYLAFFRLLMVIKMDVFINLDHEATVTRLNAASAVIVSIATVVDLWKGGICNPKLAILLTTIRIGIKADFDTATRDMPTAFPLSVIPAAIAIITFLVSIVIKEFNDSRHVQNEREIELAIVSKSYNSYPRPAKVDIDNSASTSGVDLATSNNRNLNVVVGSGSQINPLPIPQLTYAYPQASTSTTKAKTSSEELPASNTTTKFCTEAKDKDSDSLKQLDEPDDVSSELATNVKQELVFDDKLKSKVIPVLNSTLLVQVGRSQSPTTKRLQTGFVEVDVLRLPATDTSEICQVNPAQLDREPTPSFPPCYIPRENTRQKMFERVSFSIGIAFFLDVMIFFTSDTRDKGYIRQVMLTRFYRFMVECMPMYWVLMIDECFSISLRRTKTWLADNLKIYLD